MAARDPGAAAGAARGRSERGQARGGQARGARAAGSVLPAVPPPSAAERRRARRIIERLVAAYPDWGCTLWHRNPFELLIATVLAAQTTDETVNRITPELFRRYPTPQAFLEARPEELEELLRPTGYYRQKARAVRAVCQGLVERFGGEVPRTVEELTQLKGVGRKTAGIVIGTAYGVPAIGVDTHVDRVSKRLELVPATERDRDRIEARLRAVLPEQLWIQANWLLILHGRRTCTARKPACSRCPVRALCRWPEQQGGR